MKYKTVKGFVKHCNKLSENDIGMLKGFDNLSLSQKEELYNLSEEMAQISNKILDSLEGKNGMDK